MVVLREERWLVGASWTSNWCKVVSSLKCLVLFSWKMFVAEWQEHHFHPPTRNLQICHTILILGDQKNSNTKCKINLPPYTRLSPKESNHKHTLTAMETYVALVIQEQETTKNS
jgi:hypothetical protein